MNLELFRTCNKFVFDRYKGDARITLKDIEDGEEESEDELQPVNFGVRQTPKPVSAEAHIVPEAQKGIKRSILTKASKLIEHGNIFFKNSSVFYSF